MGACDEIRPYLTAWLDGELGDVEARRIDDHVAICVDCGAIVHNYRAIRAAVDNYVPADGGLCAEVDRAIDAADPLPTLVQELREMRLEMQALRAEVAGLRAELGRRPASIARTSPLSLPDAAQRSLNQYRLV